MMRPKTLLSTLALLSATAFLQAVEEVPDPPDEPDNNHESHLREPETPILTIPAEYGGEISTGEVPASGAPTEDALMNNPAIRRLQEEAIFHQKVQNFSEVIRIYQRMLEIAPDEPDILLQLGTTYAQMGDTLKAIETLSQVLERDPYHYAVLNNLAYVLATSSDLQFRDGHTAMILSRRAILSAPDDHHVWNTLSEAYFIQGEYEKAVGAAEMSFRLAMAAGLRGEPLIRVAEQVEKCQQAAMTQRVLGP